VHTAVADHGDLAFLDVNVIELIKQTGSFSSSNRQTNSGEGKVEDFQNPSSITEINPSWFSLRGSVWIRLIERLSTSFSRD
jgi:hypothetical protein